MDSIKPAKPRQPTNGRLLRVLISPSLMSGLLCILIGMGITGALVIQDYYQGSELQRQFFIWHKLAIEDYLLQAVTQQRYTSLSNALRSIQLFVFWYAVGLVLYSFGNALYTALRNIKHLSDSLGYTNTNKRYIVRDAALQFGRQLGALLACVLFTVLSVQMIIPYCFSVIHIANHFLPTIIAAGVLLLIPIVLALCLHVHIVLIRLYLGRPRIWSSEEYSA